MSVDAKLIQLALLSAPFDVKDVKQRTQAGKKLDYISIDVTIRRLNEVLGSEWSTHCLRYELTVPDGGNYLAVYSLQLSALDKTAVGIGAATAKDPDQALKTALAEALKKAGHQFGIGLYLWDEAEREVVAQARVATTNLSALKAQVFEIAVNKGAEATASGIADFYGVDLEDLQKEDVLKTLLSR